MGKIEVKQPEPVGCEPAIAATRQPVLIVAVGRQRVGKTTLLNVLIETYRSLGAQIEVWNGDLHNRTHTLSLFHKDALQPPTGTSIEEQKGWIEERVREQVTHRRDAVLDVGGGLTALNTLIEEIRLVEMLEQRGVRVEGLPVVALLPERDSPRRTFDIPSTYLSLRRHHAMSVIRREVSRYA